MHGFALEPAITVDTHADRRIAERDIERNLCAGVGEIPGIRRGGLDNLQATGPTESQDPLIVTACALDEFLHLLLNDHLKGFRRRSALGGISQGDLLEKQRIG